MMCSWRVILLASATAGLGVVSLSAGLLGWLRCRASLVVRGVLLSAGFLLVVPNPVADVALLLGLLPNTVTVRYRRALARLRELVPGSAFDDLGEEDE